MKIIQGKIKKISRKVTVSDDISELIKEMVYLCYLPIGRYSGGLAVAHCQVDNQDPMRFFVTKEEVYVNPKILEKINKVKTREGCLSFSTRAEKKLHRYNIIVVQHGLDEKIETIEGKLAHVFQHEIEHFQGKDIYNS